MASERELILTDTKQHVLAKLDRLVAWDDALRKRLASVISKLPAKSPKWLREELEFIERSL